MRSQRANFRGFYLRSHLHAGRASVSPRGTVPFPREKVRKKVVRLGKVRWSRASVPRPRGNGPNVFGLRAWLRQVARVIRQLCVCGMAV